MQASLVDLHETLNIKNYSQGHRIGLRAFLRGLEHAAQRLELLCFVEILANQAEMKS